MQDVAARTAGTVRLGPGTLYGSIKRMLHDGLIEELEERPDPEQDDVLRNDLRYAIRTIRRAPAFSLAVMLTVALTIAANTSMFSVVNAVLFRPLPYADAKRLVQVAEKNDRLNIPNFGASVLNFVSW